MSLLNSRINTFLVRLLSGEPSMNIVTVKGSAAKKRRVVQDVIDYMLRTLLPRFRTLDIDVHFSNLLAKEGVYAFCHSFSSREFIIELDRKLEYYDLIETVCHEMIHVKQHVRKELQDYHNGTVLWKNRKYDMNYDEYTDFPWEHEAYEKEFLYAKKYLNSKGANL